ncbi:flavin reductase family protein [Paludicola sp. MB14-C6]|uniref:flavin reductase family protein n=1 Tax=Paludihabitans sp. MB14-C6 TaxID=3070656 RepID=UPI0027DD7248|nr:flavin reductase family protein [Paludicola sp. MB14-C6]WMJ23695.1 flavin reductase family protein [Paludicola sp. MB14-C6]
MQKQTWKPSTLIAPIPPAMVTCGTMEESNIITIAWTGIVNTIPPMTYISVRPERYSYDIIKNSGEFVINLTTSNLVRAADFCGVRSGANLNKFEEMKLTKAPVSQLSCPCIDESPLNLECKVKEIIPLGSHHMFLAEIVAVNVAEEYIDESGRLRLDKASIAAFAHGEYYELGRKLGSFGYSVQKKKKAKNNKLNKNRRK